MLPLPGVVSEPLAHRQDRAANIAKAQEYFCNTVMNATGPRHFRSWEVYESHLPRRETQSDGAIDLYACNYYVTMADLNLYLVSDVFKSSSAGRPNIKYAMHGSGMGKTACVLQGVLHAESTRDVRIWSASSTRYVAFHNNRGRLFKASAANLNQTIVNRQKSKALLSSSKS